MTSQTPSRPSLGQAPDADLAGYRAISGLAVAAVLTGLFSATALLDAWFWVFPGLGIVLGGLALWRIARAEPAPLGRKAALVGVGLSLAFGAVAVGRWATQEYCLRQDARQFATDWLTLLTHGQPQLAHQFTISPSERLPLEGSLWPIYRRDPEQTKRLRNWVADPFLKTLLLLGDGATIRYWSTEEVSREETSLVYRQVFSVTFEEPGEGKKTFYVLVTLHYDRRAQLGRSPWTILGAEPGYRPRWLGAAGPAA